MKQVELLSPAGSTEGLEAALRFGADAVYLGGPFLQLRAASAGFDREGLCAAVSYAHAQDKKVYVTVNAFAGDEDILALGDYARFLADAGADAAIVSDLGALLAIKEAAPALTVHISTQANCCNFRAARAYYDMGASRIVLARELSLEQIAALRGRTPPKLELEAFVHGAMCMAYSGRCMISAYLNARSANAGACTQPCRWQYALVEAKRPGEYFPVEEDGGRMAILSSQDMNCIALLARLRKAGVTSFKIEGRMKSPYYVATVTNAYRMAIEGSADMDALHQELESVSHRPYATGFYLGPMQHFDATNGAYHQSSVFVGKVLAAQPGRILVEQRNAFRLGETLEALSPGYTGRAFTVKQLQKGTGEPLEAALLPQGRYWLDCPFQLEKGDILRRRASE
ncbi:Uncharacterized protease yhbU precursor [uncultured Clostridium sp.]|nr:Uncharacterized protease yhbU precursor [uncultured Clostridium sp.]